MQIKLQNQYNPINSIILTWQIYVLLLKPIIFGNKRVVLTVKAQVHLGWAGPFHHVQGMSSG